MILESPTSTAALLGQTERGPLTPRLVTSLAEFKRLFGTAPAAGNYLADAAEGFFLNGGDRLFIARIVSGDAISARSELLQLQAIGPGAWGNRIFVQLSPNGEQRFSLRIACFGSTAEPLPANPFQDAASIMAADSIETFEDLQALDPRGPDYWRSALAVSLIVRCLPGDLALSGREVLSGALAGGSDGSPIAPSDFLGLTLEEQATGLLALSSPEFAEVTLLAAPGVSDHDFLAALCAHCQSSRYRFAVLDGPLDPPNILELDPRTQWDTSFAAFYVPWLKVGNDGARIAPPSGHVLGIFARTDREQGIWKAPANQLVVERPAFDRLLRRPSRKCSILAGSISSATFPDAEFSCGARAPSRAIPSSNMCRSADSCRGSNGRWDRELNGRCSSRRERRPGLGS